MPDKISVLIAEDQDITRLGLKLALGKLTGIEVVGEAVDGEAVIEMAEQLKPNIILMDIGLPSIDGIQATIRIKQKVLGTRIIMFTSDETDDALFNSLRAGADGYCLKKISADQLQTAIKSVMHGAAWLDPGVANRVLRAQAQLHPSETTSAADIAKSIAEEATLSEVHLEVLRLIEQGFTKDQMAAKLHCSVSEVEQRMREILGGPGKSRVKAAENKAPQSQHAALASTTSGDAPDSPNINNTLQIGTLFAEKYRIKGVLGRGGMSIVYDAQHEYMERRVAIKMLDQRLAGDQDLVKRFRQEARACSNLSHPNLVTVFDSGITAHGQPYLIMDFLDGINLEDFLAKERPRASVLISFFLQVCDALDAAHRKGIIHRDLKPSNIMLVIDDTGCETVKLLDFGIAKSLYQNNMPDRLTKAGEVFGTPAFMSPEQCMGKDLDPRSDIYSLGCVMYEAFTGERAFSGNSLYEVFSKQINEKPSSLPMVNRQNNIIPELEALIFKMIAKDSAQRPQSALDVKLSLLGVMSHYQERNLA